MNINEWKKYTNENIISGVEAREITGQSPRTFKQSVDNGLLKPAFEWGTGPGMTRVYYLPDVEKYAQQVKERKKRLQK